MLVTLSPDKSLQGPGVSLTCSLLRQLSEFWLIMGLSEQCLALYSEAAM